MNTQIALNKRLFDAVSDGDLELLNRCLAEGADVNAPDPSSRICPARDGGAYGPPGCLAVSYPERRSNGTRRSIGGG